MNDTCEWCVKTSKEIDSLEFQLEAKDAEIKKIAMNLKARRRMFKEVEKELEAKDKEIDELKERLERSIKAHSKSVDDFILELDSYIHKD